jgi:hypothetical protein
VKTIAGKTFTRLASHLRHARGMKVRTGDEQHVKLKLEGYRVLCGLNISSLWFFRVLVLSNPI